MINLYDILEAADGQLFGEPSSQIFTDFCFDSRRAAPGQIFVALKTNQGDGHNYMEDAVQKGATGIMCTHPPTFDTDGLTVVVMRDVEKALIRWTERILKKYGTSIIAVTGSSGKSSTKEAIATVLGTKYNVYKNPGSYNGRFGLPLALGKLTKDHQLAVLEYGIDQFGEMKEMVDATKPMLGVVTNIGHSHLDRFGSLENIASEKGVLIENLPHEGIAILNYDDPYVRSMQNRTQAATMTVSLDIGGNTYGADLTAYNILVGRYKTGFDIRFGTQRYVGKWTPLLGAHQVYGVVFALAVGLCFEIPIDEGLRALTEIEYMPGRMRPLRGINGCQIIDDTYSATYENTLRAMDWLETVRNPPDLAITETEEKVSRSRIFFVMGDINGLGAASSRCNRDIGIKASSISDVLVTKGETAKEIGRSAQENGMPLSRIHMTFSAQDAAQAIKKDLGPQDIVLIKGSPEARMERVVRELLADPSDLKLLPRHERAFDSVWMDRPSRPTWLHIDMDAIAYNIRRLKEIAGENVALMAVVKANAYGMGAVAVSTTALLNGASYLGVASINEAIELREAGISAPILVLGYTPAWAAGLALRYDITVNLYDIELMQAFDRAAMEMNGVIKTHVKIDTGMARLGLLPHEVSLFFRAANQLKHIEVEGVFTHFSSADSDNTYTNYQIETFERIINPLIASGFQFKYIHAANSAGMLRFPNGLFNMVRPGIAMYGFHPGPRCLLPDDFKSALVWKTTIAQVKRLPRNSYVGYGKTYHTTRDEEKIAVIPVGYADGFRRTPKTWGYVLVHGQKAPIVGRVSMDQTMINVSEIDDIHIGDEVVLIGQQGNEEITVDSAAENLGTINYELISTILARVPRVK